VKLALNLRVCLNSSIDFETVLEDAAIGIEMMISEFDTMFARTQEPGTMMKQFGIQAYQKTNDIPGIREFLFDRILSALSPPVFIGKSKNLSIEYQSTISEETNDDGWTPELPIEQETLSSQIGKFGLDMDLEKTTEERLDMLHNYFMKVREAGIFGEEEEDLLSEAERLELKVCLVKLLVFSTTSFRK
jgi:hypothetical protein